MMLIQQSKSTSLPVSLAEVKAHLNIETSFDDDNITGYIKAALELLERETNRSFADTTWSEVLPCFPCFIQLHRSPLNTISFISYYDSNNDGQSLTDYYLINPTYQSARIYPIDSFPDTYIRPDAVEIKYSVSWEPELLKQAVKLLVAFWNEGRGDVGTMPDGMDRVIYQLKEKSYK